MSYTNRLILPWVLTCLAAVLGMPAGRAVTIDLVPVGNAGNANSSLGYGGVAYDFQIGKYDVTIGQYNEFLNAVAKTDTYSLYYDDPALGIGMASDAYTSGISRSGSSGSYSYSVIGPSGTAYGQTGANRPIVYVSWWNSARFANWMANGQPTGAQDSTTTENGAYNLADWTSGTAPARNGTNPNTSAPPTFFIPNENEWYKAAYYSPVVNSGSGGYYTYATQSNTAPGNVVGSQANQANLTVGNVYSLTQLIGLQSGQNYLTDVGAFTDSASFYGTFDQSGNVFQWNDLDGAPGTSRGYRGGAWYRNQGTSSAGRRYTTTLSDQNDGLGFRLASPVAVPEPSTYAMALAGLACGGYSVFRRRRAR